jgi:P4 family phage/plasmid primase-like protien
MAQYRNLTDFLKQHTTNDKNLITHTRIGDKKTNVFPGKYHIPEHDYGVFLKLYYRDIFNEGKKEYLTEKQLQNGKGPILVDLDFRYDKGITQRQHCNEHIDDLISLYIEEMANLVHINKENPIDVYVLEKPNVNTSCEKYTKDGIHMIINVQMDHTLQCILRENVMKKAVVVLEDLDLINEGGMESVFDDGISKGHTNWQMLGSRKPNNESYELKRLIHCKYNPEDNDIEFDDENIKLLNMLNVLSVASARSTKGIILNMKDEVKEKYESYKKSFTKPKTITKKVKKNLFKEGGTFDIDAIRTISDLEALREQLFEQLSNEEYEMKETDKFLMALPSKYYNNYNEWIRCGWALHNTDTRLFISWLYFSSQSQKFNFDDIPELYELWNGMRPEGVTNRSIMYWCREENPVEYQRIKNETVDHFIELTLFHSDEWDVANVLYQIYKDEYKCASVSRKTWYRFVKNRWVEDDRGTSLRKKISSVLSKKFGDKANSLMEGSMLTGVDKGDLQEKCSKISASYSELSSKCKRTTFKQNLMHESAEIFYDREFLKKLNEYTHLICFKNGVIDLKEKCFRQGKAEDYISLSTNINYIKRDYNDEKQNKICNEITDFMKKLFPDPKLNRYMWEHLASVLSGENKNQTFNMYLGSGSNGKSKLVDLMGYAFGDYKGDIPISYVTQKRGQIGAVSPEIAALKGKRYAVMSEPSKGDRLNDGIMKELTGGDVIKGRALFQDQILFKPQFSMVVCTNTLFDIPSNDDGTWRRIRLCNFESKFVKREEDIQPDEENPYQYLADFSLDDKLKTWAPYFMSMLVEVYYQTDGIVKDCDKVLSASNEYRKGQDFLMEFKMEKIEPSDEIGAKIKKMEVYEEFKKWYTVTYGNRIPKGKELYDFLDKKLGRYKNGWNGYKIRYDMDEDDDDESNGINNDGYC